MEEPRQETEKQESPAAGNNLGELMAEGKRCLAAGDASGAVENFQEACALMAEEYGQLARELAEPYYLYGKALLELARGQTSVLGTGIPVPEENPSSDDEEDQDEEGKAESVDHGGNPADDHCPEAAPGPATSSNNPESVTPTTSSNDTESVTPTTSSGQGTSTSATASDAPGPSGEGGEGGKEEEEEESDLKLAWEMLELTRVICQKQEGDDYKLKLADVNLALGEVSLESDQYEQAVEDLMTCLQLREFVLEPTDRRLAEVHFSLGLAYSLAKRADNAVEEYKNAKKILEMKKEKLQKEAEGGNGEQGKCLEEVKELEGILPDIDSKIADAQEMKRILEEKAKEEEESSTSIGFGTTDSSSEAQLTTVREVPVTDISHLVRKRPADEQAYGDKMAKRIRTEEKPNGEEKFVEDSENKIEANSAPAAEQ